MILPHETISSLTGSESIQAILSQFSPLDPEAAQRLTMLSLAVEVDLMTNALDFYVAGRTGSPEAVPASIARCVAIDAAWRGLLAELAVPAHVLPDDGPPRHFSVDALLKLADGEAEPEAVKAIQAEMREFLTPAGS